MKPRQDVILAGRCGSDSSLVHVHVVVIRRAGTLVNRAAVVVVISDLDLLPQTVNVTPNLQRDPLGDLVAIEVERVEDLDPNVIGVDLDLLDARNRDDCSCQSEGFGRVLGGRFGAHEFACLWLMAGPALNGIADAGNGVDLARRMPLPDLRIREYLTHDTFLNFGHLPSPMLT